MRADSKTSGDVRASIDRTRRARELFFLRGSERLTCKSFAPSRLRGRSQQRRHRLTGAHICNIVPSRARVSGASTARCAALINVLSLHARLAGRGLISNNARRAVSSAYRICNSTGASRAKYLLHTRDTTWLRCIKARARNSIFAAMRARGWIFTPTFCLRGPRSRANELAYMF